MLQFALAPALLAPALVFPVQDDLFPRAKAPLILEVTGPDSEFSVSDLLQAYGALTDQQFQFGEDVDGLLKSKRLELTRDLEVPIDEIQKYFELVLLENQFILRIVKADGIRVLAVDSLATAARSNLRSHALFVPEDSLSVAAAHPAMLFTTVIAMPHCDTRQLSNSMRTMITDANIQQMLPAGSEDSIVLVGIGGQLWNQAQVLYAIEDRAAERAADQEPKLEVIKLEHGNAAAMATLLTGLLGLNGPGVQEAPARLSASRTKIMADERTNSLVISAHAEALAKIKRTIAALDQE